MYNCRLKGGIGKPGKDGRPGETGEPVSTMATFRGDWGSCWILASHTRCLSQPFAVFMFVGRISRRGQLSSSIGLAPDWVSIYLFKWVALGLPQNKKKKFWGSKRLRLSLVMLFLLSALFICWWLSRCLQGKQGEPGSPGRDGLRGLPVSDPMRACLGVCIFDSFGFYCSLAATQQCF